MSYYALYLKKKEREGYRGSRRRAPLVSKPMGWVLNKKDFNKVNHDR